MIEFECENKIAIYNIKYDEDRIIENNNLEVNRHIMNMECTELVKCFFSEKYSVCIIS